jgi:DNA-binding CsgD family transcriptional regulator
LVDKSLVQADADIDGRYRLLETVRQYAQARLVESTESREVRDRHLQCFLALAEDGASRFAGAEGGPWLARIERDHDNVRAAFEWADTAGLGPECLRLVTAMAIFWELRGHLAIGGEWFSRALAHDTPADPVRSRALWGAAHVALYSDDILTAMKRAPEALALAEAVGDERAAIRARNTVGFAQLWLDPPGARASLDDNISRARTVGDDWAVGDGLKMITISWMVQDDWPAARDAIDQLRRYAEPIGNRFFLAWCHYGLGYAALSEGEVATAQRELATAAVLCDEIGDPATSGLTVAALGELDAMSGRRDDAQARLEDFVQRATSAGGDWGLPFAALSLASLHLNAGEGERAIEITDMLVAESGLPMFTSWALSLRGAALVAVGDPDAAVGVLSEARAIAEVIANPRLMSLADHQMARLAAGRGETNEADDLFHRALALRHDAGLVPGVLESLDALACLAADQASYAEAVRLLAATTRHRENRELPRCRADARACEAALAQAAGALDEPTYAAAWSEGSVLELPEAVAYASRARGERKRPTIGWQSLTPTELDVVRYAAQGLTNPQIGEKLFISRTTVKTHLAHIFTKLGVATRSELAARATRRDVG